MAGPNWKGKTPDGVGGVFRSSTELAAFCPRVLLNDTAEDRQAIQAVLNQVMVYPLSQFDGKMKTKDWKKVPNFPVPGPQGAEEIHWVNPETFFDQLPDVLARVPAMPGEEALYVMVRSVLDAAAKDPQVKQVLKETAVASERDMINPLVRAGARSAANPHAACDAAGTGDGITAAATRARRGKPRRRPRSGLRITAPVPDPTRQRRCTCSERSWRGRRTSDDGGTLGASSPRDMSPCD
jgi:hypothetical protein